MKIKPEIQNQGYHITQILYGAPMLEKEARERQLSTLKKGDTPVSEQIPERGKGKAAEHATQIMGTNERGEQ